ncbi:MULTISPECIES: hypothetical protein [unclassified Microcoleus]|uniref:hypothetical protein n=1 Tax=unclassified Microcoleus TaxID=2642155 RepID=UPI002FD4783E
MLLEIQTLPKFYSDLMAVFGVGRSQEFNAKLAKMHNSKIVLSEQKNQTLWVEILVKE